MRVLKITLYILAKVVVGVLALITLPIWFPLFLVLLAFSIIYERLTSKKHSVTMEA